MTLIELKHLTVGFRDNTALEDISLEIVEGGHTFLSGSNGAGKSTLLRVLRGEVYPTAGSITWQGEHGPEHSPLTGRALCGLVSSEQIERYSRSGWNVFGREVLLTGLSDTPLFYTNPTQADEARVAAVAARFGLEDLLETEIVRLSQGQLSLLLLGRACMRTPRLLLLDEFTNALDQRSRSRVLDIVEELATESTLLVATHRRNLLPPAIQRELCLERGKLLYAGPLRAASVLNESGESGESGGTVLETAQRLPMHFTTMPPMPTTAAMPPMPTTAAMPPMPTTAAMPPMPVTPAMPPMTKNPGDVMVRPDASLVQVAPPAAGQTAQAAQAGTPPAPQELITLRNATVYIDRRPILHDINWSLRTGEHWAVLGENGAGKTTFLRLLAGEEFPAEGGMLARHTPDGTPVRDQRALRAGVRILSDRLQATYAYNVTGLELVLSGFESSIGLYREFSADEIAQARQYIKKISLPGPNNPDSPDGEDENLEERSIRTFSTGQFRRLLLARALVGNPYLLLLDEPFSGLDEPTRLHMIRLLDEMAPDMQYVMVSHHDADLPSCIDHVLCLDDGRVTDAFFLKKS